MIEVEELSLDKLRLNIRHLQECLEKSDLNIENLQKEVMVLKAKAGICDEEERIIALGRFKAKLKEKGVTEKEYLESFKSPSDDVTLHMSDTDSVEPEFSRFSKECTESIVGILAKGSFADVSLSKYKKELGGVDKVTTEILSLIVADMYAEYLEKGLCRYPPFIIDIAKLADDDLGLTTGDDYELEVFFEFSKTSLVKEAKKFKYIEIPMDALPWYDGGVHDKNRWFGD